MKVEEKGLDVLQNLEFGIAEEFRREPSLLDLDARDAVPALIRHYRAGENGRTPPVSSLGSQAQAVFDRARPIGEWRLGRGDAREFPGFTPGRPVSPGELLASPKPIENSIQHWTRRDGRQGHLCYMSRFQR